MVLLASHSHSNSHSNSSPMQSQTRAHSTPNKHNKSASISSPSYSPAESPSSSSSQHKIKKQTRQNKAKHSDSYLQTGASTSILLSSPASSASSSPSTSPFLHPQSHPSTPSTGASTASTVIGASSSLPDSPVHYPYNVYSNTFHDRDSLSSLAHRFDVPALSSSTGNRSRRASLRHSSRDSKQEGGFPINARKLNAFLDLGTCDGNESNGSGFCLGGRNRICPYTDLKTPSLAQLARINLMPKENRPEKLEDIADSVEDKWPMQGQQYHADKDEEKENEDLSARKNNEMPPLAEALRLLNPKNGERIERLILPLTSSSLSFASLSDSIKNGACIICAVYLVTFPDSSSAAYHWLLSHGPWEYSEQLINRLREKTLHKKQDIRFSTLWVKLAKEAAKTVPYAEAASNIVDGKVEEKDCDAANKTNATANAGGKSKANDEISREILVGFFDSFKNINRSGEVLHRQNFQRIEFDLYEMLKRHQITKEQWKVARNSFALHSFKPFVDREEKEVEAYLVESHSDDEDEIDNAVSSPTLSASSSFSSNASSSSVSSSTSSSSSRRRPSIRLCGKTLFTFNVVSGELTCISSCSQVAAEDSRYCSVCIHKVLQKKRMLTCLNYRDCNNHAYQGAHVVLNVLAQRENLNRALKAQLRLCQFCMIQEQFRLLDDEMTYGEAHGAEFQAEVARLQQMKAKMDANMDEVAGEMIANVLDEEEVKVPEVQRKSKLSDFDEEPDEEQGNGNGNASHRYPRSSHGSNNSSGGSQSQNQPGQQYPSGNHSTYAIAVTPAYRPSIHESSSHHQSYVAAAKSKENSPFLEEKHTVFAPAFVTPARPAVFLPYVAPISTSRLPAAKNYNSNSNSMSLPIQQYPRLAAQSGADGNWRRSNNPRTGFPTGATVAG